MSDMMDAMGHDGIPEQYPDGDTLLGDERYARLMRDEIDLCFSCSGTHTHHEPDCPQRKEPTK